MLLAAAGVRTFAVWRVDEPHSLKFTAMKKLIYSCIVLLVLATAMSSCKKEDNGPSGPDTSDLLRLTDNGETYETGRIIKRHQDGFIGAGAPNSFTSAYGIAMPELIEPGTYDLTPTSLVQVTKTESSGSLTYTAQSGTMTISEHDKSAQYIAGTFNCVIAVQGTSQTRTITNGAFRINY